MSSPHDSNATSQQPLGAVRGCGEQLRNARLAAGLSQQDVAERLKMPLRVVQSLEVEDWSCLGAPVFVRGQLRSYGRLLGLNALLPDVGLTEPAPLVSRSYVPQSRHLFEHTARRLVYLALTAAFVLPVWLATQSALDQEPAPILPLDVSVAATTGSAVGNTAPVRRPVPMIASLTALTALPVRTTGLARLDLVFTQDSWLQVVEVGGRVLDQGVVEAGQRRSYSAAGLSRIVLGNAQGVEVSLGSAAVDLAPYQRANVARFKVSSDGSLAAAAH